MTPMKIRILRNAVFATLAIPLIAHAAIIPARDINELVKSSDALAIGRVFSSYSAAGLGAMDFAGRSL
jgi:hypothetical protein